MNLISKLFGKKKQTFSNESENENIENKKGLGALEFIIEISDPNFNWGGYASRANTNLNWLLEEDPTGLDDSNEFIVNNIKKLLNDKKDNIEALKAWLLPRLESEEKRGEITYPTIFVLQVLGILDSKFINELVEQKISIIGDKEINPNSDDYYYKLGIMSRTLDVIIPIYFRRSFGSLSKKKKMTSNSLTEIYSLFENEEKDEFDMVWRIIKLNKLFNDSEHALPTYTVGEIINGEFQRTRGFNNFGFLNYLKNTPKEENSKLQELRKSIINNNNKISKEITDSYSY